MKYKIPRQVGCLWNSKCVVKDERDATTVAKLKLINNGLGVVSSIECYVR